VIPTTASVVICCYTEQRWDELSLSIDSVLAQSHTAKEIIVVVDYNAALETRLRARALKIQIVANRDKQGLSGARNTGVEEATGEVVVFLDDDAWADPDWLKHMLAAYDSPDVAGVGGAIEPIWPRSRPAFFPPEFDWVIGCTYSGMQHKPGHVRNLIGANMSLRRGVLDSVGSFDSSVGRTASKPLGGEDTELCIRVLQTLPNSRFIIEDDALVHHHVSPDRTHWSYFLRRCYAEGTSKAHVGRMRGASDGLSSEIEYSLKVIPAALGRNLFEGVTRVDAGSFARAAAIGLGLATTTAGWVTERVRMAVTTQGQPTPREG
jgi:glycosyltransferase involved in cell wall biosynthesis